MALLLAVAMGGAYAGIWSGLGGITGCGPPGNSSSADLFTLAPFVLPMLAGTVLVALGLKLKWRRRILVTAVLVAVGVAAAAEIFVLFIEIGAHHCTE
jgi:hypothetical protein